MNAGIILSGGIGSRFGSRLPKQYQRINGREVISYSIDALKNSKYIDDFVVVTSREQQDRLAESYAIKTAVGGNSRNESLKNGLDFVADNFNCEKIIILEAARPMITSQIIDVYIEKLDDYDSVITGQKIVDSLGCYAEHTANRDDFYLIQAPEAFRFKELYENFSSASKLTATNQQMPHNSTLYINFDFTTNHKITYFEDLAYCEGLMNRNEKI